MEVMQSLKTYGGQQATQIISSLLGRVSDEGLIRIVKLSRHLSDDPEVLAALDHIQRMLRSEHPTKKLFRRVLGSMPPENRTRLFQTLFYNSFFQGGRRRDQCEQAHGFRPPTIMILSPTLRCNLRCQGCYTLGYGMRPQLEYELVSDLLHQCRELGIGFITILGGEPLVYPHLLRIIEEFPDIFFQVYTNGTLMNDEWAAAFRRAGNVIVVVSIEGDRAETDAWRGQGVHAKIMRAFETLNRNQVCFGTSATVTRHNAYKVASLEFIDQMIALGSLAQMYFLYIPVNGQADFDLMVLPEQRDHLRRHVIQTRATRPIFILDFWNDGPHVNGCIAGGRRYFHVNALGDVEPCVYTHIATHNIKEHSLQEALDSDLFRHIRACQPHNDNHLRPCMIIDNPQVMREVIGACHPRFTHPGAEEIYQQHQDKLDAYAASWAALADPLWEKDYGGGQWTTPPAEVSVERPAKEAAG
ncbi:MAG: radical SAM protein [Desulfarculus sp.]|jgi:MoaA/NifB/PqqE/SkfB family radical SAM enzyme|nr:MAG: radical SAM protein [Desulfarculus sp.]